MKKGVELSGYDNKKLMAASIEDNDKEQRIHFVTLKFDGYCTHYNRMDVPAEPGIYCVYLYQHNPSESGITPHKLLYIGSALNVKLQLEIDEMNNYWQKFQQPGEKICFSFAPIDENLLKPIREAMIFRHKPPANNCNINWCFSKKIIIICKGKTNLLYCLFEVG